MKEIWSCIYIHIYKRMKYTRHGIHAECTIFEAQYTENLMVRSDMT